MIEDKLKSIEAEHGTLGSLLTDFDRCIELCVDAGVSSDWFTDRKNSLLYELISKAKVVDLITIGEEARSKGILKSIGGYDHLEALVDATPTSAHAEYYIDILRDKRDRRTIRTLADNIKNLCEKDDCNVISEARAMVMSMEERESGVMIDKVERVRAIMEEVKSAANGVVCGNPFPWDDMNKRTGGLRRGCVTPLIGRDGQGKSTLLTYLCEYWGTAGIPTLVFPFEDGAERYMKRMAGKGRWSNFEVENCSFANTTDDVLDKKMELIESSLYTIADLPVYFADGVMGVGKICDVISTAARKYGIKQVVIDNAKDVVKDCSNGLTEGEGSMTRNLSNTAKRHDLNVLISSHVHDVHDDVWLTRRNVKGSKEQKDGARQVLMFQNAFNIEDSRGAQVHNKYIVKQNTRFLQMDKNNFGEQGMIGVVLEADWRLQTWVQAQQK